MKLSILKTELPEFTEYLHGKKFKAAPKAILKKYKSNKERATEKLTSLLEAILSKDSWAKDIHHKKNPLNRLAKKTIEVMKSSNIPVPSKMKEAFKKKVTYSKKTMDPKPVPKTKKEPVVPAPTPTKPPLNRDSLIVTLKKRAFKSLDFHIDYSVVSSHKEAMLDSSLSSPHLNRLRSFFWEDNRQTCKQLALQALEVKQLFKDTHYTFTHAQSHHFIGMPILIKELVRKYTPERDVRGFKFFRAPEQGEATGVPVQDWMNDHEPKTREELLSCSPHFFDTKGAESALYFLVNDSSIMRLDDKENFYRNIIKKFVSPSVKEEKITKAVKDIIQEQDKLNATLEKRSGVLYTISIPKQELQKKKEQLGYLAHPLGSPCKDYGPIDSDRALKALDKLQEDTVYPLLLPKCFAHSLPQYRVQIKKATPELGTIIQRFTPFRNHHLKTFKQSVAKIVDRLKKEDDQVRK